MEKLIGDGLPVSLPAFFEANFQDGAVSPHQENGGRAYRSPADGGSGVANGSGRRFYVRTRDAGYSAVDFDFRVDFDTHGFQGNGDRLAYIGLGDGTPYGGFYDEPGQAVGFHLHLDPGDDGGTQYIVRQNFDKDPGFRSDTGRSTTLARPDGTPGGLTQKGLYTAQIIKQGDLLTFSLLFQGRLVLTGRKRLSETAPYLNAENSRLYFGTSAPGVTFRDFRVTSGNRHNG